MLLAKFDTYGSLTWAKNVTNVTPNAGKLETTKRVQVDSSGNIYTLGERNTATLGFIVQKYDSSGSLTWSKIITPTYFGNPITAIIAYDLKVDSSGNVYIAGQIRRNTSFAGNVIKLNSSGSVTWSKVFYPSFGASGNASSTTISVDTSGNVYMAGNSTIQTNLIFITRLDSSGATLGNTFYSPYNSLLSSVICPNGNISFLSGNRIITINSSEVIQWARSFTTPSQAPANNLPTDSSSNLYFANTDGNFFKLNSSGTLVWNRRYVNFGNASYSTYSCAIDSNQSLYTVTAGQTSLADFSNYAFAFRKTFSGAYLPATVSLYNSVDAQYQTGAITFTPATINPNTTGYTFNNVAGAQSSVDATYTVASVANPFVLSNSAY
jgi:hypothetical protein